MYITFASKVKTFIGAAFCEEVGIMMTYCTHALSLILDNLMD